MKNEHPKFWVVWNPQGRTPTCMHNSKQSALQESKRLARENPTHDFFVLKSVSGFRSDMPTVSQIALTPKLIDDGIPF